MSSYRTEIVVPPDRYVYLQLPPGFPEGRAMVVVDAAGDSGPLGASPAMPQVAAVESDDDRGDIEWWEEFDDDRRTSAD